jgi:hypothetical protein
MIHTHLSAATRALQASLIAAFSLLASSAEGAQNFFDNNILGVDLGNASGGNTGVHRTWAIFALSGGVTISDASPSIQPDVKGNVGLGGAGNLTMTLSQISGTVYNETGSYNGGGTVTGGVLTDASYVNTAANNATTASNTAAGLSTTTLGLSVSGNTPASVLSNTPATFGLNNVPGGITDNGTPGTYVLNLNDLILSGAGAILTITGTASTNYVININRYLALSSGAQIALSGGLQPQNVLFNVKPASSTTTLNISGGASLKGIVLAPSRNVTLTGGATVEGEVIGKSVSLSGSSRVINPLVSP